MECAQAQVVRIFGNVKINANWCRAVRFRPSVLALKPKNNNSRMAGGKKEWYQI